MSQLLQPGSFKCQDLRLGCLCPDDIESSVLSEMKGPLKEHIAMNTTRTRDNDGVYEEAQCYFETDRTGSRERS